MGNIGSDLEKGLNFKGKFSSRAIFQPILWNYDDLHKSRKELNDDIKGDDLISANLKEEFKKVEEFLKLNNLQDYFKFFEDERVIFSDLKQFLPSHDEEISKENDEMLESLIKDSIPRERFKQAIKKEFLSFVEEEKKLVMLEAKKKSSSKKKKKRSKKQPEVEVSYVNLHEEYNDSNWYLNEDLVISGEIIGGGSFGSIRRGVLKIGLFKVSIAVKEILIDKIAMVSSENNEEQECLKDEIIEEIEIMTDLNHRNICKCFGAFFKFTEDKKNISYSILELCAAGDLYNNLHYGPSPPIPKYIDPTSKILKSNKLKNMKMEYLNLTHLNNLIHFFEKDKPLESAEEAENKIAFLEICKEYQEELKKDYIPFLQSLIIQKLFLLTNYCCQIAEGLAYLHKLGLAHFDIKSKNILLKGSFPKYRLKICDFGTSCQCDMFEFDKFIGTIEYMAPQFFNMSKLDNHSSKKEESKKEKEEEEIGEHNENENELRSAGVVKTFDIYSFGVVMFEIMNQKIPFKELRESSNSDFDLFMKIVKQKISPISQIKENLGWVELEYYVNLEEMKNTNNGSNKKKKIFEYFSEHEKLFSKKLEQTKNEIIFVFEKCLDFDANERPVAELIVIELNEILVQMKQNFTTELELDKE